jgi:hypothetical protein
MRILGISAFYHDSAAALIEDGRIIAAAQEERFTRQKFDSRYPANAIAYCLAEAGKLFEPPAKNRSEMSPLINVRDVKLGVRVWERFSLNARNALRPLKTIS